VEVELRNEESRGAWWEWKTDGVTGGKSTGVTYSKRDRRLAMRRVVMNDRGSDCCFVDTALAVLDR